MKLLLITCLILVSYSAGAQTWNEWFKQKKTQKKYLLKQIAALKVYAGYLEKGYEIAGNGLNIIKNFTNREYNLHSSFIHSLELVNPNIIDKKRITEITDWQNRIFFSFNQLLKSSDFSDHERRYFKNIRSEILKECQMDLDELKLVISPSKLEMKDDERLARFDKIWKRMRDKYQFTNFFISQAKLLIHQRNQDEKSLSNLTYQYKLSN